MSPVLVPDKTNEDDWAAALAAKAAKTNQVAIMAEIVQKWCTSLAHKQESDAQLQESMLMLICTQD